MRFVATALVALALAGEDFYALLGVKRNANLRDIKKGMRAGRFANRSEAARRGGGARQRGGGAVEGGGEGMEGVGRECRGADLSGHEGFCAD